MRSAAQVGGIIQVGANIPTYEQAYRPKVDAAERVAHHFGHRAIPRQTPAHRPASRGLRLRPRSLCAGASRFGEASASFRGNAHAPHRYPRSRDARSAVAPGGSETRTDGAAARARRTSRRRRRKTVERRVVGHLPPHATSTAPHGATRQDQREGRSVARSARSYDTNVTVSFAAGRGDAHVMGGTGYGT